VGESAETGDEGVDQQVPAGGGRPREVVLGGDDNSVDKVREHGQTADPVREDVVKDQDQRRLGIHEHGDGGRRPKRPVGRQPGGDRVGDNGEQVSLVPRRRAGQRVHVVSDVEVSVIDPDRSPASGWNADQALAEPGDPVDPLGDRVPYQRNVNRRPVFENQELP